MQLFDSGMDTIWTPGLPESKNDNRVAAVIEENSAENWSGRRESNPRLILGKDPFYH